MIGTLVVRKGWFRSSLLLVLSLFLALASLSPALASSDDPRVLPPDSRPQGRSYGQWAGEWWQVFVQIPATQNPIAGAQGCFIRMDGHVGLLAAGSGPQECTVQAGTMLLIPLVTVECSTVEPPPFHADNPAGLAACLNQFTFTDLHATLDGVPITDLSAFVVRSPVYQFSFPADNVLGVPGPGQAYSMAAGPHLMLAPLALGKHNFVGGATIPVPPPPYVGYQDLTINVVAGSGH